MSIYKFRVPTVIYASETYIVKADTRDEAWEKLRAHEEVDINNFTEHDRDVLLSDADLMCTVYIDGRVDPPYGRDECSYAFETDSGDVGCTLTIDECGFRLCDDVEKCPRGMV